MPRGAVVTREERMNGPSCKQVNLTEFGRMGERWVARKLRDLGFSVEEIGESSDCDLLVNVKMRVEVKAALPSLGAHGRGVRWQASLRRW